MQASPRTRSSAVPNWTQTTPFSKRVYNGFRDGFSSRAGAVTRWCDAHPVIAGSLAVVLFGLRWLVV